jgi:HPt (histidine-containing phosphotransfer) domain-containing protein
MSLSFPDVAPAGRAELPPAEAGALDALERVGGARLVRGLTALYADYAPVRMAEARQALDAGDTEGVRRACHALRAGGAQLGLRAVAALCAEAEAWGDEGDTRLRRAALERLERELAEGLTHLAAHRRRGCA